MMGFLPNSFSHDLAQYNEQLFCGKFNGKGAILRIYEYLTTPLLTGMRGFVMLNRRRHLSERLPRCNHPFVFPPKRLYKS